MKSLIEYIEEALAHYKNTLHSKIRMNGDKDNRFDFDKTNNIGNIKHSEIKEVFDYANNWIENICLDSKFKLNESQLAIRFKCKNGYWLNFIFWITDFDRDTFDYKIKIKTMNKELYGHKFNNVYKVYEINGKNKKEFLN